LVLLPGFSIGAGIAGGYVHSLAFKNDGTVLAWGRNNSGQLGDGTNIARSTPVQVSGLSNVIAVSGGGGHSIALKNDGTVWAWGSNGVGQLGDGTKADRFAPVQVVGLSDVIAIDAGDPYTVALKSDGTAWIWGCCYDTQGLFDSTIPLQVPGLNDVAAIKAGYYFNVLQKKDGTVWAWGRNDHGQIGDGTNIKRTIPVQVSGLSDIIAIAAGNNHAVALKRDGTVWTWGGNQYGQLGDGTTIDRTTPVRVNGLGSVVAISATSGPASGFTVALKNDGTVWAWGDHHGVYTGSTIPTQVPGLSLNDVNGIDAGGFHTLLLKNDGAVWAWGWGTDGVLGNGSDASAVIPVQVAGPDGNGFLNLGQVTPSPQPEDNNEIVLTLEDPTAGSTYSKTASISGWAVSPSGVSLVELYIDDTLLGQIPLGISRPEIGSIYADYPNAERSGFSQVFNYEKLSVGSHTIRVQVTDNVGQKGDISAAVNVVQSACKYKLSPESGAFLEAGGNGTIKIRTTLGCAWTTKSNASWISILSGASGERRGAVQYRVEELEGTHRCVSRIGTITIGGLQHRISQTGDPSTCGGGQ